MPSTTPTWRWRAPRTTASRATPSAPRPSSRASTSARARSSAARTPPGDPATDAALRARGERPSALHNNCSGKHAGFLALARQLAAPVERYLDVESPGQRAVRRAVGR
jgi:L-asparaginase II